MLPEAHLTCKAPDVMYWAAPPIPLTRTENVMAVDNMAKVTLAAWAMGQ